jgi:hypothetical protein
MVKTIPYFVDHVFHTASTEAAQGALFENPGFSSMLIEITRVGVGSSSTVKFWGSMTTPTLANMIAIPGTKPGATDTIAVSTTGTGELWRFDIRGMRYVSMELDAIAGTNATVSIVGRALA